MKLFKVITAVVGVCAFLWLSAWIWILGGVAGLLQANW